MDQIIDDILFEIFKYINPCTSNMLVCKRWTFKLFSNNSSLWRHYYWNKYSDLPTNDLSYYESYKTFEIFYMIHIMNHIKDFKC